MAALERDQWAHWTKYMLEVLRPVIGLGLPEAQNPSTEQIKARECLARWRRQINTPYADLSEKEKNSDRVWADKVLEITGTASSLMTIANGAYTERAQCVAALVRLALGMGLPAGIVPETSIRWACAYIETPEGQVAWHLAQKDLHYFDGIPTFAGDTSQAYTTDEKYRRLAQWAGGRNLDGEIIELVQQILSAAHFIVETPSESVLVTLMKKRGNPIEIDDTMRDIKGDYRLYEDEHFGLDFRDAVEGAVNTFDADRVAYLKAELRKYNQMDLRTANVVRGGKSVSIPEQVMREWEFVGLNNTDLIDFWDFNSAELLRENSTAELDGFDFKDAVEEAYSFNPRREEPDTSRDRKLVSQPSAIELLMKAADIIDEQLALNAQSPGESHIGPGAVSAAIRTAINICKKEA